MEIRIANKSDYPKLRELWNLVFGDSPDFVDMLYERLDATGYIVCEDDTVVSGLTFFEVGEYEGRKVKMSYAICTHPNYRGKGYVSKLISFVYENEISDDELSLICPAEKSLIKFYSKTNYQPFFYAKEESSKATEKINISIQSISPKEYMDYREQFLKDIPHIKLNQNFLEFIEKDSLNSNSLILINGGDAICVIEDIKNDTIII
ncbi:MAG: GNAT family N-acetyltransferase, partial [Alphaproteobacteria bacterium]|nr:GNAT family N-acetyltransferase [Alphaproteobacteria bacterium]